MCVGVNCNKTHHIMTSVENSYLEVNTSVTLRSDPLTEVTWCRNKRWRGGVAETETPFTLLEDTVTSTWFWGCRCKVKKLHNDAWKCVFQVFKSKHSSSSNIQTGRNGYSESFDWRTRCTIGGTVIYFHVLDIMTSYLTYDPELYTDTVICLCIAKRFTGGA